MNHTSLLLLCAALVFASTPLELCAAETQLRKINVGPYDLSLLIQGQGSPTVVIEAGFGEGPTKTGSWKPVIDAVSKVTTVCAYDRAGIGLSGPLPPKTPRTSLDTARVLHRLLTNAPVSGPYILVGHSIAGLHVRVFASQYSNDVAGVVLVDVAHPDNDPKWLATLPAPTPEEPKPVTKAREFLVARMSNRGRNPEQLDWPASAALVRATPTFGSKPLVVLTHNPKWKMVPDLPDEILGKIENETQQLQKELARLSTDSRHIIASKAGHAIHEDEPQLVIDGILHVIQQVRQTR